MRRRTSRAGRAYEEKGDYRTAILDENIAIRLDPFYSAEAYSIRAAAYEKKGDKAKAAADRAKAEELRGEPLPDSMSPPAIPSEVLENLRAAAAFGALPPLVVPSDNADLEKLLKDSPKVPK